MPIHECFPGLRDRLGNKAVLFSGYTAHTTNTSSFTSVTTAAIEKSHKAQMDISAATPATPATPETPLNDYDAEYWQELYEERAAIMEFDGGISRKEAEHRAYDFIQQKKKEYNYEPTHTTH